MNKNEHMKIMPHCLLFFLCLFMVFPVFGQQNGQIKGIVTDSQGRALAGASITLVDSTGKQVKAMISDRKGLFLMEGLTVGEKYAIHLSLLGYQRKKQDVLITSAGKVNSILIRMQERIAGLDGITVTGYRKSLEDALILKKNSINTIDAIVAEDIAKFPQSNMAEALQRISGIQIGRDNAGGVGNTVSIRGLPSEYTQVTINGDEAPNSTDGRSYEFNTLPAEVFNKVEVEKTPTASSTEGGIGGSINLVTKKPFELNKKMLVASAEGLYNTQQQEGNTATPKFSLAYGNKWNNKFGIIAGVFYNKFFNTSEGHDIIRYYPESYDLDADGTDEFENVRVPFPRYISQGQGVERFSANLGLQYQVNKDFDLVFEGLFVNNDQTETRYTTLWNFHDPRPAEMVANGAFVTYIAADNVESKLESQQQHNVTKNYRWGLKGKYNLHSGWKVSGKFSHAFNKWDAEQFRYYGENTNAASYSVADNFQFFNIQTATNFSNTDDFVLAESRRYVWDRGDEIFNGKLDVEKKFSNRFNISFGGSFRDRTKTQEYFYRSDNSLNDPFAPVALLLTGFMNVVGGHKGINEFLVPDFNKAYDMYGSQLVLDDFEMIASSYDINEKISAGYLQGNYSVNRFSANAGLRIVNTAITSRGYQLDDDTQIYEVREIKNDYIDYLPSVNIKWELANSFFIRGGFARVITRPSLQQLSSYRLIDDIDKTIRANNPYLDPFRANQYDLSLEWYPNPETLLSGAFFIKDIESFISQRSTIIPFNGEQYELRQPVNGNNATIRGFEVSYQQPFTFLPGPLGGLGIVANYTFAESDFREQLENGSSTTYPLPNNSKHTFNLTPYYQKYGFSLRVATNFRSSYLREIPNPVDGLKYKDNVSITDISSSYEIKKNLSISLNILNAFNSKGYEYIFEKQYMDNTSYFGTTYQIGLRTKF